MRAKDHTKEKFGRLTAISRQGHIVHGGQQKIAWLCRCECGNEVRVQAGALTSGNSTSCGCAHATHGASDTPVYKVWHAMLQRCEHPADHGYALYGGRGITICAAWHDFAAFVADMGERPEGAQIDRIDVDGPYSPENCRWVTPLEQANNRRNNRRLTHAGMTKTAAEWARDAGLNKQTLLSRLNSGWAFDEAISRLPDRAGNQLDRPRRDLLQVK